jgi:3-dehydroquinate synthetase
MALADIVARNRTILRGENERLIFNELLLPLIVRMPDGSALEPSSLMLAMKKDKKRTGKDLPLVMLKDGLELVKVDDLKESELKAAVKDFRRRICNAAGCRSREIRKT